MLHNSTFYSNEAKPINYCGKVIGYVFSGSKFTLPFSIEPTTGTHDFRSCEVCLKNLASLNEQLKSKFEGNSNRKPFPFCCPYHSKLLSIEEFDKKDFITVPEMVANKIIYTNQHCINNHNSEDWYKKITDYIDWTVMSFGEMPINCGEPLFLSDYFYHIKHLLQTNSEISKTKKERINEFLQLYKDSDKKPVTDLNILYGTYEKWLKIFPFELNTYFGNLKNHFLNEVPILNGKPEVNLYSGIAKVKLHTKNSLIESLVNLTNNLLTQINGITLYEKGLITDVNKIKLELIINSRKLRLTEGYKNDSQSEEKRYRKILKEWFNDEKKFIDEIIPLLNSSSNNKMAISENHDLDYYRNEKNIPNQELVEETIEYFESGAGARAFKPIEFLNLLEKQQRFINDNVEDQEKIIIHLKTLPLSELEKHILIGFIIKWLGGYPLHAPSGYLKSKEYYNVKKDLLNLFLAFAEDTPEKEFCKANNEQAKKLMKMGIAFTNAMRSNMDIMQLLSKMEEPDLNQYSFLTFDELFEMALLMETIEKPINKGQKEALKSYHNFNFNVWLQNNRGWEYGNKEQYMQCLNKENWKEYLQHEEFVQLERKQKFEIEKRSWHIEKPIGSKDKTSDRVDDKPKLSISACALMHVYLYKHGGRAVTQQNKNGLAKEYGFESGNKLRNEFTGYQNEDKRTGLHTTNKNAAKAHINRFKQILPLLKTLNYNAFTQANNDLTELERIYNKHY